MTRVVANAIPRPATARSARSRAAVLKAARGLIESDGFGALTMAAVADGAGLTRRAVYLHFKSRADLVAALFDHVAETEGLAASLGPVWDAPTAPAMLDAWAEHLARYNQRILAVDRATVTAARLDPDAERHLRKVAADQRATASRIAERLAEQHSLAPPWTRESAADLIYAQMAPDIFDLLVNRCGWSAEDYATRLATLLRRTLTV